MIPPHLHSTSPFFKMAFKSYNTGWDFHDFPFFYVTNFLSLFFLHYASLKLWQRTFVRGGFYRGGSPTTHVVLHGSGVTQPRSGWEGWIKGALQLNILLMILLNLWVCDTEDGAKILFFGGGGLVCIDSWFHICFSHLYAFPTPFLKRKLQI